MTRHRVTAWGVQTSLAHRKRRSGERLLLAFPGPAVSAELRALLRAFTPAGFVLSADNLEEPAQVADLALELRARLGTPHPPFLALALDTPVPGGADWPPLAALGETRDPALAREVGTAMGQALAAMGVNTLLGPLLNPSTDAGSRAFGASPRARARLAAAFVAGVERAGVLALPGWFPGFAEGGPEDPVPVVEREVPEVAESDLQVFRALAGAAGVRLAAGTWPAWDEDRPACLSPRILALLREEGVRGLAVAPDLHPLAGALRLPRHLGPALGAGLDLAACGGSAEFQIALFETLVRLQEEDPALDRPLDDADTRLGAARERLARPPEVPPLSPGDPAHQALALAVRARSAAGPGE